MGHGQGELRSVHGPLQGPCPRSVSLLPDAWVGETLPGSFGVLYCIPQTKALLSMDGWHIVVIEGGIWRGTSYSATLLTSRLLLYFEGIEYELYLGILNLNWKKKIEQAYFVMKIYMLTQVIVFLKTCTGSTSTYFLVVLYVLLNLYSTLNQIVILFPNTSKFLKKISYWRDKQKSRQKVLVGG